MIVRQSNRVAQMENPSKDDLMTVLPADLFEEDEEESEAESEKEPEAEPEEKIEE